MGNGNTSDSPGRQRAKALKAADARTLLKSSLPFLLQQMAPEHIQQVQKVMDAAVVNPVISKEADELYRRSVTHRIGTQVNRDPKMVRRAERVAQTMIPVTEKDKHIRLDFSKLLAHDALLPTTDNPDEVAYLSKIRQTLASKGVWLRIGQSPVRDPENPSRHIIDPRTFELWLSLGYDGDAIPTRTGRLTRDELLGTTVLGAGYYTEVHQGKIQSMLDMVIKRLESQISTGETLHEMQETARDGAAPLVVPISDFLGGANFPSKKIWNPPSDLVRQSLKENVEGNVKNSTKSLIFAAVSTQVAAELLDHYIDDTTTGAQRAVKILNVMVIAGKIAEAVLVVRALVGGLVRLLATEAAETGGTAVAVNAAKNRSPGAYAQTNYNGRAAFEKTVNQAGVTLETDAGIGTALDRYDLATRQRITGWHNDFTSGLKEAYKAKGRTEVSMRELEEIAKRADAKWGNPLEFLP